MNKLTDAKKLLQIENEIADWKGGRETLTMYVREEVKKLLTEATQSAHGELMENTKSVFMKFIDEILIKIAVQAGNHPWAEEQIRQGAVEQLYKDFLSRLNKEINHKYDWHDYEMRFGCPNAYLTCGYVYESYIKPLYDLTYEERVLEFERMDKFCIKCKKCGLKRSFQ